MSGSKRVLLALCCVALAAGCRTTKDWPELSLDKNDPADENVQPPSWYKPVVRPDPWPLGPEPDYGTAAWRTWWAMRQSPRAVIRLATAAPKIDGLLDDEAWRGAEVGSPFLNTENEPAAIKTTVSLVYDKENVYVAARMDEPEPGKIRAEATENGPAVNGDDHFGMSLVVRTGTPQAQLYWLRFNAKGHFVGVVEAEEGKPILPTAVAVVGEKDWTVEVAIPLKALGVADRDAWGEVWGCGLIRFRTVGDEPATTSWAPLVSPGAAGRRPAYVIVKGVRPKEEKPEPADGPAKEAPTDEPAAKKAPEEEPADEEPAEEPPTEEKPAEETPAEKPPVPEPAPKEPEPSPEEADKTDGD